MWREKLASKLGGWCEIANGVQDWERLAREAEFKPSKMALLCAVSERHLQRIFKRSLSCTPRHFLRELQCGLALDLIQQGYSSKAAAAELKFATEAHFCREFKRVFGASPQTFAPNHVRHLNLSVFKMNRASQPAAVLA